MCGLKSISTMTLDNLKIYIKFTKCCRSFSKWFEFYAFRGVLSFRLIPPQTGHNSNHLVEQLKLLNEINAA